MTTLGFKLSCHTLTLGGYFAIAQFLSHLPGTLNFLWFHVTKL